MCSRDDWTGLIVVGRLTFLETDDEEWVGTIMDSWGHEIHFHHPLPENSHSYYKDLLVKVQPASGLKGVPHADKETNVEKEAANEGRAATELQEDHEKDGIKTGGGKDYTLRQQPVKMIGQVTVIEGANRFLATAIKIADAMEYAGAHALEAIQRHLESEEKAAVEDQENISTVPKDPYNDEQIIVSDGNVADLLGTDRLHRVIWRYLTESRAKSPNPDTHSDLAGAIRGFCASKWRGDEVNAVLDNLDECGLIIYADTSKNRVSLVDP